MPRIVFARLKVNEQKQIAAGVTVSVTGESSVASATQLAPDSGCTCPITIKHGCRIDPSTNSAVSPLSY